MMEKGSITESMDSDLIQTEQSGKFSPRKQQAGWALKDEKWGGVGQKQWEGEHCRQSSTSAQGLKAGCACLRDKGKASVDVVQWVRERAPQDEVSVSAIFGTIMLCNKQAQTSLVCSNVSIAHVSGELSISSKICSMCLSSSSIPAQTGSHGKWQRHRYAWRHVTSIDMWAQNCHPIILLAKASHVAEFRVREGRYYKITW